MKEHTVYSPRKLTWQWKITILNRGYIFKWLFFHCHVSFRESIFAQQLAISNQTCKIWRSKLFLSSEIHKNDFSAMCLVIPRCRRWPKNPRWRLANKTRVFFCDFEVERKITLWDVCHIKITYMTILIETLWARPASYLQYAYTSSKKSQQSWLVMLQANTWNP